MPVARSARVTVLEAAIGGIAAPSGPPSATSDGRGEPHAIALLARIEMERRHRCFTMDGRLVRSSERTLTECGFGVSLPEAWPERILVHHVSQVFAHPVAGSTNQNREPASARCGTRSHRRALRRIRRASTRPRPTLGGAMLTRPCATADGFVRSWYRPVNSYLLKVRSDGAHRRTSG